MYLCEFMCDFRDEFNRFSIIFFGEEFGERCKFGVGKVFYIRRNKVLLLIGDLRMVVDCVSICFIRLNEIEGLGFVKWILEVEMIEKDISRYIEVILESVILE